MARNSILTKSANRKVVKTQTTQTTKETLPEETLPEDARKNIDISLEIDIIKNNNLIHEIFNTVMLEYNLDSININNIARIVTKIMELVEETDVKGVKQKVLVNDVIKQLVLLLPEDDKRRIDIINFIEGDGLDSLIEIIISASKGELDINNIVKTGKSCMVYLEPYFIMLIKCIMEKMKKPKTKN